MRLRRRSCSPGDCSATSNWPPVASVHLPAAAADSDRQAGTIRLAGELDRSCAERVTDAVATLTLTTRRALVIDVAKLTFCDVEGVRALARARGLALERGCGMRLVNPSPWLAQLLRLAGIAALVGTPSS
ncbi:MULTISPECIES: STAS domain-containing protein [unclassified Blastococcus]|uniref:STAS domain-containing protein n=1 Tax=unclassified Blastococcus TaxID=2619396 RepID=UPI000DEB24B4|nr:MULTISPECIES: STAS domain-containing protein [unclassified Blastococcus]RBY91919.1 hypothetical protein DQ237_19070 [Blastococcus sp. TF02-8]TFV51553.1 anti-sigma factor antagonist [Blastococcus sp. TF02A_35]